MSIDEQKVWDKAKTIKGRNPKAIRSDPYGDEIRRRDYGKDTKYGWDVDHIKPKSLGGSDDLRNLQALHIETNRAKGDSLVKRSRHNQK